MCLVWKQRLLIIEEREKQTIIIKNIFDFYTLQPIPIRHINAYKTGYPLVNSESIDFQM